jgi:hypothetical protein
MLAFPTHGNWQNTLAYPSISYKEHCTTTAMLAERYREANMASIKCTECGREVSNKAATCPACGCPLQGEDTTASAISPAPKVGRTVIIRKEKQTGLGIFMVLLGIVFTITGIATLVLPFIGLICLFSGIGLIGWGANKLKGELEGTCPHCSKSVPITATQVSAKCVICKKRSVRNGDYLDAV